MEFSNSKTVNKAYKKFYEKNGYIPELFNPYNCAEITDIAPSVTTACGAITTSAAILILEIMED